MGEGKNLVGVDIGTSSIKVCQLKETRKGPSLLRLGFAPLAPQTIVDGQVMDASNVVETLQRVFHDSKIRQRECAISVSGQSVIIRKITVPMMTQAELDEQIHWEAEQHIPFDIKDVQVDYQVLRRRPEASQMDLLLAGNYERTRANWGRFDANHGTLLLNQGNGQWAYVPQYRSGFHIQGDVRHILSFDQNGRQLLLLGQTNAPVSGYVREREVE